MPSLLNDRHVGAKMLDFFRKQQTNDIIDILLIIIIYLGLEVFQ